MDKFYAGIGSRETPDDILENMFIRAIYLGHNGYTLRSGHAPGADIAFEKGCDAVRGRKEIYLPWEGFNGSDSNYTSPSPSAFEIAEIFHPAWHRCSRGARALHARNVFQILGTDFRKPVDFVICWTRDGKASGGTGLAMRIAAHYGIKIYNLFNETSLPLDIPAA